MNELVDQEALRKQQQEIPPPLIIDVRDRAEYIAGHIPGALHLPAAELEDHLGELPHDRPIVPY